eukprot:13175752-Alexandrium_andersonii.AAC.1
MGRRPRWIPVAAASTAPGGLLASLHGSWPEAGWPGPSAHWWPRPRAVRRSRANAAWRARRRRCGEWVAEHAAAQP